MEMVADIRIVQAEHSLLHKQNTKDLEEHIKRTNLLEEDLQITKKDVSTLKEAKLVATTAAKVSWKTITLIVAILLGAVKLSKDLGLF